MRTLRSRKTAHLAQVDDGHAIAAAILRGGGKTGHGREGAQEIMDLAAQGAGAAAVHDLHFTETH